MEFKHYSVLRDETIENLNIRPDGIYVDGTLGGAGHSYEIAKRLSDKGRLIGIDQDADAIKAAGERLAEFGDRVTIVRSNYSDMKNVLHSLGIEKVDGIMLDLGVSRDNDNRRAQRDNKGSDTPKGQSYRWAPVEENISGYKN